MVVYTGPSLAILCGLAFAAVVDSLPRLRVVSGLILAGLIAITNLPFVLTTVMADSAPTEGMFQAMDWLRQNTPEPLGDAAAYSRYYPRRAGVPFVYPPSAYGVAVWWDFGYLVSNRARRIPSSNGTQAGASETAYFYSETDPHRALEELDALGARYALVDPTTVRFGFPIPTAFDAIVQWSGRPLTAYYRVVYAEEEGRWEPAILYLPDYFRSMAVRMYFYDAKAAAAQGAWVVSTGFEELPGRRGRAEVVHWKRRFDSEKAARQFIGSANRAERLTLASFDTSETCVDLEPVERLHPVFSSDPGPISHDRVVKAVKVFEVSR
jgi:hypothetical protein